MKKRAKALGKLLKQSGFDSLITGDYANIRYLTGQAASEGWLLFTAEGKMVYFTAPMHTRAAKKCNIPVVAEIKGFAQTISARAKKEGLRKIAFSSQELRLDTYQKVKEKLAEKNIEFMPAGRLIESLRMVKEKNELNLIKKSARISFEAFDYAQEIASPAISEKRLSIEVERFLRIKADNRPAFPVIVAAGKNTAFAHHRPQAAGLHDFFIIDLGAVYYGYCADLTRVFFWSKMPSRLKKAYTALKKAKEKALQAIKPGQKAWQIDKAAREIIDKKGFGKYFLHGTGHGIGLKVHEPPYLNPSDTTTLKEGMVVTVEPGIYYKGSFGIRLEDMAVIKSDKAELIK